MRYVDRSRVETDWKCPRARFHNYEFGGRGVAPAKVAFDLEFGTIVHDGIEHAINATTNDFPHINVAGLVADLIKRGGGEEDDAKQWGAVAVGMIHGFMRAIWPNLVRDYDLVAIEREVNLQLAPWLLFQARPDLLLRNKATGALWYFELKTTSSIEAQWLQSWTKAPQVQLGALACEAELGEPLAGTIVIGLYKGRKYYGRVSSPFAWGYRTEDLPGIMPAQFSYEEVRRKGWERFMTVHYPGGTTAWVDGMPEEILGKQFAVTDPIFLRRDMAERLIAQIVEREGEIARAMEELDAEGVLTPAVLDRVFPQHFFNCTPAWGSTCAFNEACWVPHIGRDPIGSGVFAWREPHHEAERKFFELKEVA